MALPRNPREKKEPTVENKEVKLTSVQICLELQIIGNYKTFVHKKYKNQSFTKSEWMVKLKKDGIGL
jgi:hypothetical protein